MTSASPTPVPPVHRISPPPSGANCTEVGRDVSECSWELWRTLSERSLLRARSSYRRSRRCGLTEYTCLGGDALHEVGPRGIERLRALAQQTLSQRRNVHARLR